MKHYLDWEQGLWLAPAGFRLVLQQCKLAFLMCLVTGIKDSVVVAVSCSS